MKSCLVLLAALVGSCAAFSGVTPMSRSSVSRPAVSALRSAPTSMEIEAQDSALLVRVEPLTHGARVLFSIPAACGACALDARA